MAKENIHLPIIYKVMDPRNSREELQQIYNEWATQYNKDMVETDEPYYGTNIVSSRLLSVVKDKEAKILDIGAGTGLLGSELAKKGYVNVDAVDPNEVMLEAARKLNIYKRLYIDYVGKNKLDIPNDTYDAIVGSGVFLPGHVTWDSFEELHRITKPGGVIIIVSSLRYFGEKYQDYATKLEESITKCEATGSWKRESHTYEMYHGTYQASLSVLRVL